MYVRKIQLVKKILLTLTITFLISQPLAFAKTEAEIEQAIQDVLSQRHPEDTPAWWRSLGKDAPTVIIRMYEKSTDIYHKLRLVQALAWFDDPQSVEFVKTQATSTEFGVVRNAAVKTVGISKGAEEIEFISKFLSHNDIQTRVAAAEALKRMGDARADAKVNAYLEKEKAPWVGQKLRGNIQTTRAQPVVVESSESRNFWKQSLGSWRGFLVSSEGISKELKPVPAVLDIVEVGSQVSLKLKLLKPKSGEFTLQNVKWLAPGKFSAMLSGATPKVEKFEAAISQGSYGSQYTIPLNDSGATLVLRKQ